MKVRVLEFFCSTGIVVCALLCFAQGNALLAGEANWVQASAIMLLCVAAIRHLSGKRIFPAKKMRAASKTLLLVSGSKNQSAVQTA